MDEVIEYIETLPPAALPLGDRVRPILGYLTDSLIDCVGGCGYKLVSYYHWGKLSKEQRRILRAEKVRRNSSRGLCWKCSDEPSRIQEANRRVKVTPDILAQLPQIWEEVRGAGGGLRELGERLEVSRERARQLVKQHGLPKTHNAKERASYFLEELEFLHSMGRGVYEISKALQMDPDSLVRKVDDLHYAGKTKVLFEGWHKRYAREKEAA
jgi:hypothetical protein